MRTTKKMISVVLALCLLLSTCIVAASAASTQSEPTGGSYTPLDNQYTQALQAIDDKYAYDGDDLGATYSPESTTFKVWSPTATEVTLNLYATGSDEEEGAKDLEKYALTLDEATGVWSVTVEGDLKNVYYTYSISAMSATSSIVTTKETQDVYSKAVGVNGKRSMVVDLDSTDPEGWEDDEHVLLDNVTDSTVWEIHVKDFSYDPASGVSEENRGKYLAFTEEGTTLNGEGDVSTCIDYLKELGITTVQLNPVYDFGSVIEGGDDSQFNWGYDPMNYNVPEGSYSSNPYDGNVRINEFKQMVQALHNAGISVVMDVVYNHTYVTDTCFQATVPNYYYRLNATGGFSNGSGCGNECATERAMYRNYLIQSCLYWVNEYHIDGFRYDLMGIMDVETMNMVRDALDAVDTRISMWGEGWSGGDSYHPATTCSGTTFYPAVQANASMLSDRIALFNDSIRDGVKGSAMAITNVGFVQGSKVMAKNVAYGVQANTQGRYKWVPSAPSQCVTYSDCHDNATLYDQIIASTGLASYGERNTTAVNMNKLSAAIINTSQGISFMLAGQEMARSKDGDTNSYKSSPEINMIKWQNVVDYADLISYYKGLFEIRSSFSPLTCPDNSYAESYNLTGGTQDAFGNQFSFTIQNDQEGEWSKMAVIYNGASSEAEVTLDDTSVTEWVIIADDKSAGVENLGEVTGSTFTVPAKSAIIAVDKASYDAVALDSDLGTVKVSYIYDKTGEELESSVVLRGTVGTTYETVQNACIPDTYSVSEIKGNAKGVFTEESQEVTYIYSDYVPESLRNCDIDGDTYIDINDVTTMQQYFANNITLDDDTAALIDVNYDGINDINDVTMLQMYLANYTVSTGSVVVNYFYTDENGEQQNLTESVTINGRVGDDYTTDEYHVVGYAVDEELYPEAPAGKIPYGMVKTVNYYYVPSSLEINLHLKHNGSLTWEPTLWIWGSDLKGVDKFNYTPDDNAAWPGVNATDDDGDGWFDYSFTYRGAGTYNVIVSNNGSSQTIDYKGFVDNEMWIVINDSALSGGSFLTFYTENPDTNTDAPIAEQIG